MERALGNIEAVPIKLGRIVQMDICRSITTDLMSRPLLRGFTVPVNPIADGVPDYPKRIAHPMDLGTVTDRLSTHKYQSIAEWYSDVRLVFQNAIDYHVADSPWALIAQYGMQLFTNLAKGLNFASEQAWLDYVSKRSLKVAKLAVNPPAAENPARLVPSLRGQAETLSPPTAEDVAAMVDKLNAELDDLAVRQDVAEILRTGEGAELDTGSKLPVNTELLKAVTVNMLILYASSID
jgi:hypothetical protein